MNSHPEDENTGIACNELFAAIDALFDPLEIAAPREAARPYIHLRQTLGCALTIGELRLILDEHHDRATGCRYTIFDAKCTVSAQCANWDLGGGITTLGHLELQVALNLQEMEAFACKYCPVLDSLEVRLASSEIDFAYATLGDRRFCEVVAERFAPWSEWYERQLRKGSLKITLRIPTVGITFRDSQLELEELAARAVRETFPEQCVSVSFEPGYLFETYCEGPGGISDYVAYRFYRTLWDLGGKELYDEGGWDYVKFTNQGFLDLLELAAGRKSGRFGFL